MKKFKTRQPIIQPVGLKCYRLVYSFKFEYNGTIYSIPVNYTWDGMSIPKFFWSDVGSPFSPKHLIAGLVHDYLYGNAIGTRKNADKKMYNILLQHGEGKWDSWKMYKAVRLFGKKHWGSKKVKLCGIK